MHLSNVFRFVTGEPICRYASRPCDREPESSHVYTVQSGRYWFDAEIYDGTNIGRFANQNQVSHTLELAKRMADKRNYVSMDWKPVNDDAQKRANAVFKVVHSELHLVAKTEIAPSNHPIEIFVSYGDTQSYWIPLITKNRETFPQSLVSPVLWMLTSPHSNWTTEEKVTWANLEV